MFSLTSREQFLVAGIIAAAVIGAAVQHWRDARREVPAKVPASDPFYASTGPARPGRAGQR
jgi:hypothetical protein